MIGQRIGPYVIEEKLGSGGYGVVYRARDVRLERPVALKFLRSVEAASGRLEERFLREARAMAAVNHPNVVTIHEIRKVEDHLLIATEFIDGETLEQRIERETITPHEGIALAVTLLEALGALHERDILHRDIKPANIMIARDGTVKLMDFGIAIGGALEKVTEAGSVSGTVGYMAPEQLRGGDLDARSDVFSVAAVLYECLVGQMPFPGKSVSECVTATLSKEPDPIRKHVPGLPRRLEKAILRCLAKNPRDRFPDAASLRHEFEAIAAERDESGAESPPPPSPRLRWLGVGLVAVAATVLLVLAATRPGGDPAPPGPATVATPFGFRASVYRVRLDEHGEEIGRELLDDGAVIHNGDRLQCEVKGDEPYHLYVFFRDSEQQWYTLFPAPGSPLRNPLPAGRALRVPPSQRLRTTGEPGEEAIWFVATSTPFPELEAELAALARPGEPIDESSFAAVRGKVMRLRGFSLEEEAPEADGPLGLLEQVTDWGTSVVRVLDHR